MKAKNSEGNSEVTNDVLQSGTVGMIGLAAPKEVLRSQHAQKGLAFVARC
jgi:hypothetical protein